MSLRAGRSARSPRDAEPLLPFEAVAVAPAVALPAEPPPRRVFLGWDRPVLHSAARWLLGEFGTELGDVLVAVPGARAAWRLRELMAEQAPPAWTPPVVLTQGKLIDALVELHGPVAGRLTRTLVWERALSALAPAERAILARPRPDGAANSAADSMMERLRLSEMVRSLHGELAPEGLDFARLAGGTWPDGLEAEQERWRVLAKAQAGYRAALEHLGELDPHESRGRAIEAGALERSKRVVLVGVADMNHLLARLVTKLGARVTALVAAPDELASGFDPLGRLVTGFWKERDVALELPDWRVAEKPVDQAAAMRAVLDEWHDELAPEELTLGIADESVVPYLERQLEDCGARARNAAGTPLERTPLLRMLRGLARYLARRGFAELAALARDPDLARLAGDDDAPARFDRYHQEHLPRHARDWLAGKDFDEGVRAFHARLEQALGTLAEREARPLAGWADPLRAFLARVYPRTLSETCESERVLAEALRAVGAALGELEEVPARLELARLTAADALQLLLRALRGERVPPPPRAALPGSVELVGWLDLALDDAPALILTGFDEGKVPRSAGTHSLFLPDARRAALGLPGDAERLARDVHAASVILASRQRHVFISARRSSEGDPLVPSRLAFHRPAHEVPERVANFTRCAEVRAELADDDEALGARHTCPVMPGWKAPDKLRVSAFRAYLSSPYQFYLECVLGLETLDDRVAELDPRRFGTLAHAVLEDLGAGPHDSTDAEQVGEFLVARLRARAAQAFGVEPLPAVELQVAQLEHRLRAFARQQVTRAAEGWRIHAVEWKPPSPVLLDVDGRPVQITGKLDRVDRHPDGRWAILDYKTGDRPRAPRETHRRKDKEKSWVDLQLPLYRLLAAGLGFSGEPELGYGWIAKEEHDTGFLLADFEPAELDEALGVARDVVRRVRAGEVHEPGRRPPYEEIWKAIFGLSALGGEDEAPT